MYFSKYCKYKQKYQALKGGNERHLLSLLYTGINSDDKDKEATIDHYKFILKKYGKVFIYFFKFNNVSDFLLEDYYFDNVSDDVMLFIEENEIHKPLVVCIKHASPYGLFVVNKYANADMFSGIVCYPLRLYSKESLERRVWRYKERGGWIKYISKKYNIDDYYINPTNESLRELLLNPQQEELGILYLIGDRLLQMQADSIPKKFKIPTILFTRLDMDVDSIIKLNYERKSIANMKGIVSENDALYTAMMWNFDRVKYDKKLIDNDNNKENLRIRYYIGGLEDDSNLLDAIIILADNK